MEVGKGGRRPGEHLVNEPAQFGRIKERGPQRRRLIKTGGRDLNEPHRLVAALNSPSIRSTRSEVTVDRRRAPFGVGNHRQSSRGSLPVCESAGTDVIEGTSRWAAGKGPSALVYAVEIQPKNTARERLLASLTCAWTNLPSEDPTPGFGSVLEWRHEVVTPTKESWLYEAGEQQILTSTDVWEVFIIDPRPVSKLHLRG